MPKLQRIANRVLLALSALFWAAACQILTITDNPVAFPGAEGFGRYASGGRGGAVFHVTTLEDGVEEGTLRYALMQDVPRTVVFDVAGTIFLDSVLRVTAGDLTIAGQSAPGDGICIAGYPMILKAPNVIVRYLRFRVGDAHPGDFDGLGGTEFRNVIVDHCTVSWSVDECCSLYGGENLTVQWCLISESLRSSGHTKGNHGYGAIFGGAKASFHHNLLAHHDSRTPRLGPHASTQTREWVDMRNNVIYNWAGNGCYGAEGMQVNIVNNYYKPGPATPAGSRVACRIAAPGVRTTAYCHNAAGEPNRWKPMEHVWGRYYVAGNVVEGHPDVTADNWTKGVYAQIDTAKCDGTFTDSVRRAIRLDAPLAVAPVTTHSAEEAFRLVVAYAGCSHRRDTLDRRIAWETSAGEALCLGSRAADASARRGLIDTPADAQPEGAVSPWPELRGDEAGAPDRTDSDGDGIPDAWERAHGLDPDDAADGCRLTPEGYTELEVYLNALVEEITSRQNG